MGNCERPDHWEDSPGEYNVTFDCGVYANELAHNREGEHTPSFLLTWEYPYEFGDRHLQQGVLSFEAAERLIKYMQDQINYFKGET